MAGISLARQNLDGALVQKLLKYTPASIVENVSVLGRSFELKAESSIMGVRNQLQSA